MAALVEPIRSGHLRDNWAVCSSFDEENTGSMQADSRSKGSHMVGTTLVGGNSTLERTGPVGSSSHRKG